MTQSNSNNRKKTVVIVALILALVLLLGIGGYTLAKYISGGNGNGEANVAKWGYAINVNTDELFGKKYKADVVTDDSTAANLEVATTGKTDVVAPGTSGSMTIAISGTAEVAAKLNISMTNVQEISLTVGDNVYNPVKWTLNDGTTDVVKDGTLTAVAAKLNEVKNVEYNAGDVVNTTYTLTWKWDFTDATNFNDIAIDTLDTALGQIANGTTVTEVTNVNGGSVAVTASNKTVKFTLTASIEQIER